MTQHLGDDNDLDIPFIFVPHGVPEPTEWMAAHPGWVKFPAVFVPHGSRDAQGAGGAAPIAPVSAISGVAAPGALVGGGALGEMALGLAEGLVAVAAPLAAAAALLWPSRTAGPEMDEYHGRRATGGDAAPEGYTIHPPQPPLPGLVPPPVPVAKPGEEGYSITPPLPSLLASPITPPLPHVLPGPEVQQQGPTTYERHRNDGLSPPLRSYGWRAREAARQADPAVTQALKDGEWRAHHLINMGNIKKFRDIFDAAAKAGWRTDEVENVVPLPDTPEEQQKLKEAGIDRPTHRGGHPDWNEDVFKELERVRTKMNSSSLKKGSDAYNARARQLLNDLQKKLHLKMLPKSKIGFISISSGNQYA